MKVYVYNKEGNILFDTFRKVNSIKETRENFIIEGRQNGQRFVCTIDRRVKSIKVFASGY